MRTTSSPRSKRKPSASRTRSRDAKFVKRSHAKKAGDDEKQIDQKEQGTRKTKRVAGRARGALAAGHDRKRVRRDADSQQPDESLEDTLESSAASSTPRDDHADESVSSGPALVERLLFDWKNPDYISVIRSRAAKLMWLREDPHRVELLRAYYKDNIADFINDWGMTFDPRNVAVGQPTKIPFILFPKQRELIEFVIERWRSNGDGLCDKSREMGVSWIMVSIVCSLCIFHKGFVGGFGSRKQEYVDKTGDPKALFWKARAFLDNLPPEFRAGWTRDGDANCRISFPHTGSAITGEAGDNIGRGDRTGIYVVDESAYVEHPDEIDAALSQTTRCRIDVSSAHGMGNPFARKRHTWPREWIFTFHWRDDPRKDVAWYEKECKRLDPIVVAQEIDINYMASVQGILIPSVWVQAAIDAHVRLGFEPTGGKRASLDIADEGPDKNALCAAHGVLVNHIEDWSGQDSNIFRSIARTFDTCDSLGIRDLTYDADGMGVSARGDAERLNEDRTTASRHTIEVSAFHAVSGGVTYPEREDVPGKLNKNHFKNRKAQAWWRLRTRFENTYKAVVEGVLGYDPDEMISLDSGMDNLDRLLNEIAQVLYGYDTLGKLQIIKTPEGMSSPNMADALMMLLGNASETKAIILEAESMLLNKAVPVDKPLSCDIVFAVVCAHMSAGRDNDGAAVTYFAHTARPGYPVIVVDWDIVEIDGKLLDQWLPGIYTRLDIQARLCGARRGAQGVWLKDETAGAVLLHRAEREGKNVFPITSELKDVDRALNVSGLLKDREVQIAVDAFSKTSLYKGSTRNHLLGQIHSFHPSVPDVPSMVLLNSFTHGVALAKGNVEGY